MRPRLLSLLPLILGCSEPQSANLQLVGPLSQLPTIVPEERLRLGGAEAPETAAFANVASVQIGSDERIYVLDVGRVDLSVFDDTGAFVGTVGARGQGPGEFTSVVRMGFVGDSLWVVDWLRQMTHFFGLRGEVRGARRIAIEADSTRFMAPTLPSALLPGGLALFEPEPKSTEPVSATGPVLLANPADDFRDTLVSRKLWRGRVPVPGLGALRVAIIEDHVLLDVDPHGRHVVAVERAQLDVADGPAGVTVTVWSAAGGVTVSKRLSGFARRSVSASERDAAQQRVLGALQRTLAQLPELRAVITDPESVVRDVVRLPGEYPPIDDLRATSDGRIWLRLGGTEKPNTWLVLDERAEALHFVRLPPHVTLHDARDDRVWGIATDSLDVQYLVRLDLP